MTHHKKQPEVDDVEDGNTALIGPDDYLNVFTKNRKVSTEQIKKNIQMLKPATCSAVDAWVDAAGDTR